MRSARELSGFDSVQELIYDEIHWNAAQRVLKYLKGTSGHGLVYCCDSLNEIIYQMYADASFGNRDEGRRSVSGYLSIMGQCVISYRSFSQKCIVTSTTAAELYAASEGARESECLRMLLGELGFKQKKSITLHCDNTATIAICINPGNHEATKSVDIRILHIRELIENKRINMVYCKTEDMIADILTKALASKEFLKLRYLLCVREI